MDISPLPEERVLSLEEFVDHLHYQVQEHSTDPMTGDSIQEAHRLIEGQKRQAVANLTGIYYEGNQGRPGTRCIATVDCEKSSAIGPEHVMSVYQDFNSIIGITETLSLHMDVKVFVVPPFKEFLRSSNHIYTYITVDERQLRTSIHQIPHIPLLKYSDNGVTRIFFPKLYQSGQKATDIITQEIFKTFYQEVLQPAVADVLENDFHWPDNYSLELWRSQNSNGSYSHWTFAVPRHRVQDLGKKILQYASCREEFSTLRFVHKSKGMKGSFSFQPGDDSFDYNLSALLEPFEQPFGPRNRWYVDVGWEFLVAGFALQWKKLKHKMLISELLQVDDEISVKLMHSGAYTEDIATHIGQLAGFRAETGHIDLHNQIVYLNVYSTDKDLMYKSGQYMPTKHMTVKKCLRPGKHNEPHKGGDAGYYRNVCKAYDSAAELKDVALRMEARIPFDRVVYTKNLPMLSQNLDVVSAAAVGFPRVSWC